MILVDANILIYARVASLRQHQIANAWLDQQLNGVTRVGLPWASLLAFMRVVTNARVFPQPESMIDAWGQVLAWLACERVWIPQPTERHAEIFGALIAVAGAHPNLISDVHLAALAMEHGLTLCSADGDFARFPELRWINPMLA